MAKSHRENELYGLVPYASHASRSRGRLVGEPICAHRSGFARDRDRIVHSTAFRRLNYKTQVFVFHEGDHYRSRLTHSIEVAQISRSLARRLRLDEDLCEAIALAHDMGHAPFGHAGERAMAQALKDFGGFDHNLQTLRILTRLEKRYPDFDGLNLCFETLEGLIKHNGPLFNKTGPDEADTQIRRQMTGEQLAMLCAFEQTYAFGLHQYASLEGQVAAIADDIAYNNHDIDDGLRAGLIGIEDLRQVPFVWDLVEQIKGQYKTIADERLVFELNRRLITLMIADVHNETVRRLFVLSPKSSDDIRTADREMVSFSEEFTVYLKDLQEFLRAQVYHNARVMQIMTDAETITRDIIEYFLNRPQELPKEWRCASRANNKKECAAHIKDYVAGMTDRYILELHRSLFDVTPKLR